MSEKTSAREMNITITGEALKEVRSIAERQKIRDVALYMDVAKSCCSVVPSVKVVERSGATSEAMTNLEGIPIYSCDLIKEVLVDHDDVRAEIDLVKLLSLDQLRIRFYRDTI